MNKRCTYSHGNRPRATIAERPSDKVDELKANMAGRLATQQGVTTPFGAHSDAAPTVYITGNPAREAQARRDFERATGKLRATNFYSRQSENLPLALAGLKDDYAHDGRALIEELEGWATPEAMRNGRGLLGQMAQVYKQINAPVGALGMASLAVATQALESNAPDEATYKALEDELMAINARRDGLAGQMREMPEGATFDDQAIDKGQALLGQVEGLASAR